jgi:GntR family transcriptional regulator, rspAB operon transcriptional repressor
MIIKTKIGLKNQIYDAIKNRILFCDYMPGSVISEDDLCKEFGVSRTPVREALMELGKEGYVNIVPRKSTKVSKISLKDITDIIQARLLIETYIVRSITEPLDGQARSALADLRSRFGKAQDVKEPNDFRLLLQIDYEFHSMLTSLCPNNHLAKFLQELLRKSIRQWFLMLIYTEKRMQESICEHEGIINALLDGDFENAAQKLELHIKAFNDKIYIINE